MAVPEWLVSLVDLPWVAWSTGGILATSGLLALGWALFADRARGRRRCPKCWYDLRGTPGLRCSECGYQASAEGSLQRRRRRWRCASVATLVALVGAGVGVTPHVRKNGWLSIVPTTVLLLLAPSENRRLFVSLDPVSSELARRDAAASLADWQWSYLFGKGGLLRCRDRWPGSMPLAFDLHLPRWTDAHLVSVERIANVEAGGTQLSRLWVADEFCDVQPIAAYPIGPQGVDLTLSIDRLVRATPAGSRAAAASNVLFETHRIWRGVIRLPIRVTRTVEEAIQPVSGGEIDLLMRRAVRVEIAEGFRMCGNAPRFVEIGITFDRSLDPRLAELAAGFRIDVLRQGRIAALVALQSSDGLEALLWQRRSFDLHGTTTKLDLDDFVNHLNWKLRIRGDAELALRDWDKPKYWAGELILSPDHVTIRPR